MEARLSQDWTRWLRVAAFACGLAAALLVHQVLEGQQVTFARPSEPTTRVAIRAGRAPAPPAPVAVLPLNDLKPKKLPKAAPTPASAPQPAETGRPPATTSVVTPAGKTLDLTQPAIANLQPVVTPALPMLGEQPSEKPPKPAEDAFVSLYTDAPGGLVVVIALLVNHEGEVLDSKLVVPSKYPLKDYGLTLAARQQKVTALQPPLAPGEVRWVEVRLTYPDNNEQPTERLIP